MDPQKPQRLLRRASFFSLVAATAFVMQSGCQWIGGIDKADYDPSLDTTTSSGDGDGDTSQPGDGDGEGGTTSTGDGDGDAPGKAVPGVVGAYFSADSCTDSIKVNADDVISCLYRVSCDPLVPSFTMTSCVTFDYLHSYDPESCSAGARDCSDVYACIYRQPANFSQRQLCGGSGYVFNRPCPGTCDGLCYGLCDGTTDGDTGACNGSCDGNCIGTCTVGDEKSWACDGDWAIDCSGDARSAAYDCTAYNGTCGEAEASSDTSDGGCQPAEPAASLVEECASVGDSDTKCSGNTLYWCANGEVWGFECAESCVEGDTTYCSFSSETCSDSMQGTAVCDGDQFQFCSNDGVYSEHACDRNGLSCVQEDYTDCTADGCSSSSCSEHCVDATTLEFCVGGARIQIDCTEYGFFGCVEEDSVGNMARCSFAPIDDSCDSANNGYCDEVPDDPSSTDALCEPGTDSTDCGDTCYSAKNGKCDVPSGKCEVGTDNTDCGDLCPWANDGVCDEGSYCVDGSDTTDCSD